MGNRATGQAGLAGAAPSLSPFLPFWLDALNCLIPNIFWHVLDVRNLMA